MEVPNKKVWLIVGLIGGVMLLFFLIRPAIQGYLVYDQIKDSGKDISTYTIDFEDLEHNLDIQGANLSSCYDFNHKLLERIDGMAVLNNDCNQELQELSQSYGELEKNSELDARDLTKHYEDEADYYEGVIDNLQDALVEKDREIDEALDDFREKQNEFDTLAQNSAANICCKMKVDDPDIDSYSVVDMNVVCSSVGEFELSC